MCSDGSGEFPVLVKSEALCGENINVVTALTPIGSSHRTAKTRK
jgi:hypothetical protein